MKQRLICFAFTGLLAACSPVPPKSAPSASPSSTVKSHGPWLHITGHGTARQPVRIVEQQGNRKQYDLLASSYVSNGAQGSAVATFSNVHVTFFGRNGTTLIASAPRAIVDETENTVTLTDRVHARTNSGMTLVCDWLRYDRVTEMVHGEGNVVITDRRGMRATGNAVDSDISLTRTRMQ